MSLYDDREEDRRKARNELIPNLVIKVTLETGELHM